MQQDRRSLVCPSCQRATMLSGSQREFNPRSTVTGKKICIDCKVEELIAEQIEITGGNDDEG